MNLSCIFLFLPELFEKLPDGVIDEIINYELRRSVGKTVGSGRVEKACDQAAGFRQKKKGMSWGKVGSRALATLKIAELNGRGDILWKFPIIRNLKITVCAEKKNCSHRIIYRRENLWVNMKIWSGLVVKPSSRNFTRRPAIVTAQCRQTPLTII
jgi:hypothetical protein